MKAQSRGRISAAFAPPSLSPADRPGKGWPIAWLGEIRLDRILLGQLGANGDCLYATAIARQIKTDFPGCRLTWAVAAAYRAVIANNPYVDEVREISTGDGLDSAWWQLRADADAAVADGSFDRTFLTQIWPDNFANYDGTVRSSMFRNFGRPITVPIDPVVGLSADERQAVEDWLAGRGFDRETRIVVMECRSNSPHSFVTPELAAEVAQKIVNVEPDVAFVLSTNERVPGESHRIVSGAALSIRQTAALTHHAELFVGCGSGISVVATSEAARTDIPFVEILDPSKSVYASFKHDLEYFGQPTGRFLQRTTADADRIAGAIRAVLRDGIEIAKRDYDEPIQLDFRWYLGGIDGMLIRERRFADAARSLMITTDRYGWHPQLQQFARRIVPDVLRDPTAGSPERREDVERLIAAAPHYRSWWSGLRGRIGKRTA